MFDPQSFASSNNHTRRPVIIDTDLSFDDYAALLFLLQHPAVDVRAITVADGVVHARQGLGNVARLLTLVNRLDIPIARGPDQPLSGYNDFPAAWRFIVDYGILFFLPWRKAPLTDVDAATLIRQQILASRSPVTIVALAPLTNLAMAIQADSTLIQHIDMIVVSGGSFISPAIPGKEECSNQGMAAEWNFHIDPLAAQIVFQSGARIALVPLDVTDVQSPSSLMFGRAAIEAMRKAVRSKASRLLVCVIRLWHQVTRQLPATPVWDAAAAALAVDPQLGRWRELRIKVLQQPQAVAGQTCEDADQPYPVQVCFGGDRAAFETAFLKLVRGDL